MSPSIKIDRKELYDLVWSKPVIKIAQDFGISDVAVAKICKKLNIPKPGLGYWAKRKHGHKVRRKSLPRQKPGDPDTHTIHQADPPLMEPENEVIEQQRLFEARQQNKIIVKKTLRNPHPFVKETKVNLERFSSNQYHRYGRGLNSLDVGVCKPSFQRTLLIMDALVKALEARGFQVSIAREYGEGTKVLINGEQIAFRIQESVKQIPNTNLKYDGNLSFLNNKHDYVPTGKLSLRIEEYYHGAKSISDGKTQHLEDCLNKFILMLVKASEIMKIEAKEAEIRAQEYRVEAEKREEVRRLSEREQAMVNELLENAALWNKCVLARNYILAIEEKEKESSNSAAIDDWVNWANKQLDEFGSRLFPKK
ncbi:MAG: hypothetical protein HQ556_13830 [Candidatus Marinimicrobia bacterium]|nr:hypothetical protein [Candidatus Neomarinimicrobiota bacterium]